ncbi:MAG: hypothetical protein IT382_11645 [Deltaproteobacteria bacterium]|nr:hypothetical protein [Deltaproteobacteria bacterium]
MLDPRDLDPAIGGQPFFARRGASGALTELLLGTGGSVQDLTGVPGAANNTITVIVGNTAGTVNWGPQCVYTPNDTDNDGFVARFDGTDCLWIVGIGGVGSDRADVTMSAVTALSSGNVVVGGTVDGTMTMIDGVLPRPTLTSSGRDGFFAMLDAAGDTLGTVRAVSGALMMEQHVRALTTIKDTAGNEHIMVGGTSIGDVAVDGGTPLGLPSISTSSWVAHYNATLATPPHVALLSGGPAAADRVEVRALSATSQPGEVAVAGSFNGPFRSWSSQGQDAFVVRYSLNLTEIANSDVQILGTGGEEIWGAAPVATGYALAISSDSNPLSFSRGGQDVNGLGSGSAVIVSFNVSDGSRRNARILTGDTFLPKGLGLGNDGSLRAALSFTNTLLVDTTSVTAAAGKDIAVLVVAP